MGWYFGIAIDRTLVFGLKGFGYALPVDNEIYQGHNYHQLPGALHSYQEALVVNRMARPSSS